MPPVMGFDANSDDESLDTGSFLKPTTGNVMMTPKAASKEPSRMLVPKSTVKPSTRKVRRLRDVSTQMANPQSNFLFGKWDGAGEESPRKSQSPLKQRMSPMKQRQELMRSRMQQQPSFEESELEEVLAPSTVMKIREKRAVNKNKSKMMDESQSEDSDVFGGNGTPEIKVRGVGGSLEDSSRDITFADTTRASHSTNDKSTFEKSSFTMSEADISEEPKPVEETFPAIPDHLSQEPEPASPCPAAMPMPKAVEEAGHDDLLEESETSAPADESSDYSNNTFSDFDSFDTSGSVGNRTIAPKLLFQKKPMLAAPMPSFPEPLRESDEVLVTETKDVTIAEEFGDISATDDLIQNMLDLQLQDDTTLARQQPVEQTRPATPEPQRPVTPPAATEVNAEPKNVDTAEVNIEPETVDLTESPSKTIKIPQTPHHPKSDAFWSQEETNDWNDKHSPSKLVLPGLNKSPNKPSLPSMSPSKAARKSFEASKHQLAADFLLELDEKITNGRIAALSESTGGVKLNWTKTLNTTAGRANWKRSTVKSASNPDAEPTIKHYATIELAEKIIDDESRLLNTLAHEFCHLANFMINNLTTNPHGKEFKAWATACSKTFSDRNVTVTTKHTYEIDFKYIWECTACGNEHKRHSRSIDPKKHRCGACKGDLKQVKPVPRANAATSEYQKFVKEQMGVVRAENPGIKQREVMGLVAGKWKAFKEARGRGDETGMMSIVGDMTDLTMA